jgi:putative membrane protein
MGILIRLVVSAFALWIATVAIDGIDLTGDTTTEKIGTLLVVAVIFGVVNAILRPIIKTLGCAIYALTLGLAAVLVNGLLLWLTSYIAGEIDLHFHVDGFVPAVLGALLIGIVSWLLNFFVKTGRDRGDDNRR